MKALELVTQLETLGVSLWEEDGQLRFRAPRSVMTEERRTAVSENRAAVIDLLRRRASLAKLEPDPDNRHAPFPLTDVQAAYLLGRQDVFDYGGVGCQIYVELRMETVDPSRLEDAWNRLMARHDMLRATIHAEGYQRVQPEVPRYQVPVHDLRAADPSRIAEAMAARRQALSKTEFIPDQWPLFHLAVTLTPDHARVHFAIDFLIADFMSVQLLLSELAANYHAAGHLSDAPSAPLALSFRDYVLAERAGRESGTYLRDRAYWSERLDTLPAAPDLPLAPALETGPPRFYRLQTVLDATNWAALKDGARRHGITPTVAVLSAYAAVIGRWTRGQPFCLNLTLLNRLPLHAEVGQLIGDFTSVSLLSVDTVADDFTTVARAIQEQLWLDMDHRLFSGVEVMRELARRRGQGGALMPVIFTSTIGLEETGTDLGDPIFGLSQTAQVWLDCQAIERAGTLVVQWDVRAGVLPDGMAEDMFATLDRLLHELATDVQGWTRVLPSDLPAGQIESRGRANATAAPVPIGLLQDGFLARAAAEPDRAAVLTATETVSYGALASAAGGIARALREQGCTPGELVAISLDKSWQQVAAVLGVLIAGGAYLPLDRRQPTLRRDRILSDAGVRLVLSTSTSATHWPDDVLVLDPWSLPPAPPPEPAVGIDHSQRAYVIYTSGSTGDPKGVVIAHGAALNTIDDINTLLALEPADRVFGLASLSFDLSVYDIFGPLGIGAALVLPQADLRDDPTHWRAVIARHGVTVWNSVPAQMQMLQDVLSTEKDAQPLSLTRALLSGDWIPLALTHWLQAHQPHVTVYSLGGATEASIWSIYHPIGAPLPDWPSVPYGRPLANQSFHVLDARLAPCPDWVTGELYIGGHGLALGYLGDPERTAARFITHPVTGDRLYRTGDLGRYRPGGIIEFLGREDFQVKIRGYRIELAEIEAALQACDGVGAAAVLVDGTDALDRQLAAFVRPGLIPPPPRLTSGLAAVDPKAAEADLAFTAALNHVARLGVAREMAIAGGFSDFDDWGTAEEILAAIRVTPSQRRLARRWLSLLTEAGLLTVGDTRYRCAGLPTDGEIAAAWAEIESRRVAHGYGDVIPRYLAVALREIGPLLRGEVAPTDLFFPEGRGEFIQAAYAESLVGRRVNAAIIDLVRDAVRPDRGPLQVLEIGAGVGGTSAALIPALADLDVDYLFTDVSRFFLNRAAEVFANYPFLRYGLFDINLDPADQGYRPNSQDVIVACNVLHNATDLTGMLGRLRALLRPGGRLVVVETVAETAWTMASMEFLVGAEPVAIEPGADDSSDIGDRLFLDEAGWADALEQAAGDAPLSLPGVDDPLYAVGQRVFAVRFKSGLADIDEHGLRTQLAERLPPYMLPRHLEVVDALPLTANGKVDRGALKDRLRRYAGRTVGTGDGGAPVDDLEKRLATLWAEVLGLEQVGRHDDFFQIGGDSLLISQLTSRLHSRFPEAEHLLFSQTMRQILHQPTIGDLAVFLRQAQPLSAAELDEGVPASALTPLGQLESGPASVLVHELGGTMAPYLHLSHELSPVVPVFGLAVTKVAVYLDRDPATLIRDLADEYSALLVDQPPARLVGYGMGALLAMAVAGRLTERGLPPPALIVVGGCGAPCDVQDDLALEYAFCRFIGADPIRAGYPAAATAWLHRQLVLAAAGGVLPDGTMADLATDPAADGALRPLLSLSAEERLARIAAAMTTDRDDIDALGYARAHLSLFRHSLSAYARYTPSFHAGDMTVLLPADPEPALPWHDGDVVGFWRTLCLGEVRVTTVPGSHFDCLKPPHIAVTARSVLDVTT